MYELRKNDIILWFLVKKYMPVLQLSKTIDIDCASQGRYLQAIFINGLYDQLADVEHRTLQSV